MAKYNYTAINLYGKKVRGAVEARDESDFRLKLRNANLVPVKFKQENKTRAAYRMKANEAGEFSREMASMLGSGITALRALDIMRERDVAAPVKNLYDQLFKDIQSGMALSESMRNQPKAFPELLINMYASGEASGQLDHVAAKMAEHYNKEHKLSGKVKSAMMYPIILAVVTVVVVMLLFTVVLPPLFEILSGVELPLITRIILAISGFLQNNWLYTIIGVLVFIVFLQYIKTVEAVAYKIDSAKLKLPVVGKLLRIIYTARFARTLSTLYSSGITMIQALTISGTIIGNRFIERQFTGVVKDVRNGEALSSAVAKVIGFDTKLGNSILVGEETGHLDDMLTATADGFEYEADIATTMLVQLIEPVMLVIMAVIIGSILLAVMLPVMSLYESIGGM